MQMVVECVTKRLIDGSNARWQLSRISEAVKRYLCFVGIAASFSVCDIKISDYAALLGCYVA
jgi:hypothetical protein